MLFNPKKETLTTLECSKCGAKAKAGCKCGAPYLPYGTRLQRAAEAIAKNPGKSNTVIADEIGVCSGTVDTARKMTTSNCDVVRRRGRDGKLRSPHGETRRRAMEAIAAHPEKSNSAIAREFGIPVMGVSQARKAMANPKPPRKGKKNDAAAAELAAHYVLDSGMTHEQAGKETGAGSELLVRVAVAREEGRREAPIDAASLSLTSQQKLEAVIRQHKRKLDLEFEQRVLSECKRRIEETILPSYNKSHAHYEAVIKARKGVMDRATYRKIISCLHPDRVTDAALKKRYAEAFHLFSEMEVRLLNEKEHPTATFKMPRTYEEMMALKQKVAEERKRARAGNGVSVRH